MNVKTNNKTAPTTSPGSQERTTALVTPKAILASSFTPRQPSLLSSIPHPRPCQRHGTATTVTASTFNMQKLQLPTLEALVTDNKNGKKTALAPRLAPRNAGALSIVAKKPAVEDPCQEINWIFPITQLEAHCSQRGQGVSTNSTTSSFSAYRPLTEEIVKPPFKTSARRNSEAGAPSLVEVVEDEALRHCLVAPLSFSHPPEEDSVMSLRPLMEPSQSSNVHFLPVSPCL